MAMHVYRFGDKVAINPPQGETFYLTADQAAMVWRAIKGATDEIDSGLTFSKSEVGTVEIETTGSRYDG